MASQDLNTIRRTSLDFDSIKTSLKDYLKSQDQFKDYDFEGSGLSVLLNVLSANTHLNAFYAQMVANEAFLDSASIRRNAVSIAKHLGYIPGSYKSAIAYVDVEFLNLTDLEKASVDDGLVFVSQNDKFVTNTGTRTFLFLATGDVKITKENNQYFARNVEIAEGSYRTVTFVYNDDSSTTPKYSIPDNNVDISSIVLRVSNSLEDTTGLTTLWSKSTDVTENGGDDTVYYLQQNEKGLYEVYFGDGIVGRQPLPGNVITLTYRVTSGEDANGIGRTETITSPAFRYVENASTRTLLITDSAANPSPSFGGSNPETIESVKHYAPKSYAAQERAVTADDYQTLLMRDFGEQAESVYVWGGEDNDPPEYGKVFISIKPRGGGKLTSPQKLAIAKNILKKKNIVSIIPEIVDPDYLYLILNIALKYDKAKTTLTKERLAAVVRDLVVQYAEENIDRFDRDFVLSAFTSYINTYYNPPVLSNTITLQMQKKFEPSLEAITTYSIKFDNELYHPVDGYTSILESSGFGYQDSTSSEVVKPNVTCYLDDDGYGNVRLYKLVGSSKIYLNETLGTINYTTGEINLISFIPQYLVPETETSITLTVTPKNTDITSRRNQILVVETSGVNVTCIPLTLRYDTPASAAPFSGN